MTKWQRQRRIMLWRKLCGARPAWIVTFALTIAGGVLTEWSRGIQRIAGLERDVMHLSEQRGEMKADMDADVERMRRQIEQRCAKVAEK